MRDSPEPASAISCSSSSNAAGKDADALAHALGDPTLELAFWLPERGTYVDSAGIRVLLPADDSTRVVTCLEHQGEPFAAIVHDPSLREEPRLIQAAGAAAHFALENARLQAETRAQLLQVQESRTRIVAAGDEARRRIERDLHDGAQQRLVALALQLRRNSIGSTRATTPRSIVSLDAAVVELQEP